MEIKTEKVTMTASTGVFIIPVCTTTERNALTAATGLVVLNSTTGELNVYDGVAWRPVNHT
jgi:hypothetical protein